MRMNLSSSAAKMKPPLGASCSRPGGNARRMISECLYSNLPMRESQNTTWKLTVRCNTPPPAPPYLSTKAVSMHLLSDCSPGMEEFKPKGLAKSYVEIDS